MSSRGLIAASAELENASAAKAAAAPSPAWMMCRSEASRLRPGPELGRFHPVDGDSLTLELDHGDPFAVGPLELGDAGDVDLLDLEAELGAEPLEVGAGEVAEMAVAGDVERQPHDYG